MKRGKVKHQSVIELIESKMTRESAARSDGKARKMLRRLRRADSRRGKGGGAGGGDSARRS